MAEENKPKKTISEIAAGLRGHLNNEPETPPIAELVKAVAEYPRNVQDSFSLTLASMQTWQSRAAEALPSQKSAYQAGRETLERRIAAFETFAEVTMLRQKVTS